VPTSDDESATDSPIEVAESSMSRSRPTESGAPNCRSALSRRAPPRTEPPDPMFGVVQPAIEDAAAWHYRRLIRTAVLSAFGALVGHVSAEPGPGLGSAADVPGRRGNATPSRLICRASPVSPSAVPADRGPWSTTSGASMTRR
jgi:hypothetical protein